MKDRNTKTTREKQYGDPAKQDKPKIVDAYTGAGGAEAMKKSFDNAWDDLIKFGDCPVCHGDPMRCPESDKPASACSRRRNAMKHSRGSVARRRGSAMFPRE